MANTFQVRGRAASVHPTAKTIEKNTANSIVGKSMGRDSVPAGRPSSPLTAQVVVERLRGTYELLAADRSLIDAPPARAAVVGQEHGCGPARDRDDVRRIDQLARTRAARDRDGSAGEGLPRRG